MTRQLVVIIVAALVVAGACRKKEPPAPEPQAKAEAPKAAAPKAEAPKAEPKAKDSAFQAPVLAALTKAGLKVGVFEQTAARPYQAKACVQGDVDGLDVLLCAFDGDQAAHAAESALLQFVGGATTGAVRTHGAVTLAVADRKKVDIKGKQINKVLATFVAGT